MSLYAVKLNTPEGEEIIYDRGDSPGQALRRAIMELKALRETAVRPVDVVFIEEPQIPGFGDYEGGLF